MSTGVYQVPLIEGPVPKAILEAEKPMRTLLAALSSPKTDSGHLKLSGASALVALQNPLLKDILRQQHPELYTTAASGQGDTFNMTLVAQNLELYFVDKLSCAANASVGETSIPAEKLKYDPSRFHGVKILSSMLSKIVEHKRLKKSINKHFADSTGLLDNTF